MITLIEQAWMQKALCAQTDPELFFPDKGDWAKAFRAKVVCQRCEVKSECLAYALERSELVGVWGGTTPEQRKQLRGASRGRSGLAG